MLRNVRIEIGLDIIFPFFKRLLSRFYEKHVYEGVNLMLKDYRDFDVVVIFVAYVTEQVEIVLKHAKEVFQRDAYNWRLEAVSEVFNVEDDVVG